MPTARMGWRNCLCPLLVSIVFPTGACVVGGQPSANALSATFYPMDVCSTGLGWSPVSDGSGQSSAL